MSQADSDNSTAAPRGRSFTPDTARLAKEEAKRWRAIKRLRKLRAKAADEIDRLLEFLDAVDDTDVDSQCDDAPVDDGELDGPENGEDEQSEPDEPSLGAFEGHDDQSISWKCGNRSDRELDGAESGIGDPDGLDEQVPFRDWQNVGMV